MDFFDLLQKIGELLEILCNKVALSILSVALAIFGYFAFQATVILPKPETFAEYFSYLFNNPNGYYSAMGLSVITSVLAWILGATIIYFAATRDEYFTLIRIGIGISGSICIITGFYFLRYFILLLGVIIVVGGFLVFIVNSGSSGRR